MTRHLLHRLAFSSLGSALALLACSLTLLPQPARALPPSYVVQCAGTESTTYSPGLTNTAKNTTITVSDDIPVCTQLSIPPVVLSGTSQAQFPRLESCDTLLGGGPGVSVITWSTGDSSTYRWTSTAEVVGGNFVVAQIGTIVSGRYIGQSAVTSIVLTPLLGGQPNILTACASPNGIVGVKGTYTLTISSL